MFLYLSNQLWVTQYLEGGGLYSVLSSVLVGEGGVFGGTSQEVGAFWNYNQFALELGDVGCVSGESIISHSTSSSIFSFGVELNEYLILNNSY